MRPAGASQGEGKVFDAFGQSQSSEVGVDDESARGHILLVSPRLDIAEAGKTVVALSDGDDGLGFLHLLRNILMAAACNTRTSYFGRLGNGVEDGVYIYLVFGAGHHYFYLFLLHVCYFMFGTTSFSACITS